MKESISVWKIAAFLLIFISVSGAFFYSECPQCGMTKLIVSKEKNEITASIFVMNYSYNKEIDPVAAAKQIQDIIAGAAGIDVAGSGFTEQEFSKGTFKTLQDAELTFYFSGVAGDTPIPGCNPAKTSEVKAVPYKDSSGNSQTLQIYVAKCTIPEELLAEKCMDISVNFQGNAFAYPATTALTVCAEKNKLIDSLGGTTPNSLIGIILSYSENEPGVCLLSMALLGLLLASMFYTGKNPLSLLDITTPKLPTPKGVASSGSVLAPMAYSRMGSRLREADKYMGKFFSQYTKNTNKSLSDKGHADLAAMIEAAFKDDKKGSSHHLKALAYRFAERDPSNIEGLRRILALNPKDRTYGRELREHLTDFQRRGGIDNTIGMMADLSEIGKIQSRFMAKLGGQSEEGKGFLRNDAALDWTNRTLKKAARPLMRVPLVGLFVTGAIGNFFSGIQYSKRFVRSVAKIPGGIANTVIPDSVRNKIHEKAETSGWKKAPVTKALDWYLDVSSSSKIQLGRHMQVADKLGQMYATWDEAVSADVNRYLFSKITQLHRNVIDEDLTRSMDINQMRDLVGRSHMIDRVMGDRETMAHLRAMESGEGGVRGRNVLTLHEIFTGTFEGVTKPEDIRLRRTLELLKVFVHEAAVSGSMDVHQSAAIIEDIHRIINSSISSHEKLTEIMKVLGRKEYEEVFELLKFDSTCIGFIHEIEKIREGEVDAYKRAILLEESIRAHHEKAKTKGAGDFNLQIGKNPTEEGRTTYTSAWSNYMFNEYMRNLEAGNGVRSHEGESLISNVMAGTWVKLLNQMYGISRAELERDPQRRELMNIMERYLHTLFSGGDSVANRYGNPEALRQYGGLNYSAGKLLESPEAVASSRTLLQPLLYNAELAFSRDKSVKVVGNIEESRPHAGWWKIDMKQYWNFGPSESNQISVSYMASKMFNVARYQPSLVEFEKRASREGAEGMNKIPVYESGFLNRRLVSMMEEHMPNSYTHADEAFRYFRSVLAEYVRRYADVAEEGGVKKYEDLSNTLKRLTNDEIIAHVLKSREEGNLVNAEFLEGMFAYLKKPVNADIYKKGVWAQTGDGSIIPVGIDTPLGDHDRVLNGILVYRDKDEGRWRKFDVGESERGALKNLPQELSDDYHGKFKRNEDGSFVLNEHNEKIWIPGLVGVKDKSLWEGFLGNVETRHRDRDLGSKEYLAILHTYSKTTGDWSKLNQRSDSIMFMNKDEFMKRGEMAYKEKWYGRALESVGVSAIIDPAARVLRSGFWNVGVAAEQFLMNMHGRTMMNLDAMNVVSERYREHAQRLAWHIWGENEASNPYISPGMGRSLSNVSTALFQFVWAWETTTDRHPTGGSYALYKRFQERTLYHFGPESPYPVGMLTKSYFDSDQRIGMFANNLAPMAARWVMRPVVTMFRNYKQSMMGQTTPFDLTGNPMDSFASTEPRTLEGLRALTNPWFAGIDGGMISGILRKYSPKFVRQGEEIKLFRQGEEIQRMMGGEAHRKGLDASVEHFSDVWSTGIHARMLDANPNLSILGLRGTTDAAVRTAEVLTQEERFGGFFEGDPYLAKQARSNVIRRFGSAGLNELERVDEMSHSGPLTRVSGWRYMNPLLLAWHFPIRGVKDVASYARTFLETSFEQGLKRGVSQTAHEFMETRSRTVPWIKEKAKDTWAITKPFTNLLELPLCPYCHSRVVGRGGACNNEKCVGRTMSTRWEAQLQKKEEEERRRRASRGS